MESVSEWKKIQREIIIIVVYIVINQGGARSVMVIVVGNWHDDTSSNPGWE